MRITAELAAPGPAVRRVAAAFEIEHVDPDRGREQRPLAACWSSRFERVERHLIEVITGVPRTVRRAPGAAWLMIRPAGRGSCGWYGGVARCRSAGSHERALAIDRVHQSLSPQHGHSLAHGLVSHPIALHQRCH